MITQTINLNLIPGGPLPRINVSQYDNGSRTLQFNLYNGVSPYEIPSGASVSIVGTKADNTGFEYACTFDGSLVSVDITDQMTVFAGEVQSELQIRQSGEVLGTANFIINVESAALSDDTQISETDIPIIQRIPEILEEAEGYADTAHKWATFGADTETPSSTNNAKYWAEQSQVYATGALHWKGSVAYANIPTSGLKVGDFYNITDDFTTDSRFDEGAGIKCAAGTNIVWDTNNKWDILTPSTVASQVKYDGTTSGLSATTVQGAIDEVVATKQIANGLCSRWSSAQSLYTSYVAYFYGGWTNNTGGVAVTSLLKGKPYKVTITGTCANVTNNIDVVVALKTANTTSGVDTDMVCCAIGSTKISGTSFTIETELLIPKTVSPTYCQYWFKKSSSSTTVTINSIYAKWEEIGVYDSIKIGDDSIQSRISNVETKGLSSQAYSTGQYFTHGDKLKKVTSAIASGESITGNNTRNTTVGAELTQINSDLEVKTYSDMVSANPSEISFLSGKVKKVGHNYFIRGTFRIASGRNAGPMFKFNDFLAPGESTSQYIQVVRISNGDNVTNLVFPGSNTAGYNNGYIQNSSTLVAGDYAFYGSWIE